MSDNDDTIPVILAVLAVVLFVFGYSVGFGRGQSDISEEAVRAGVAYYTNGASGTAQFKWKECK